MGINKTKLNEQQKSKFRIANIGIVVGLAIVLILAVNSAWVTKESAQDIVVKQEDIYCVSAICTIDGAKTLCREINPSISHIIITEDPLIKNAYRLSVNPTGQSCGYSFTSSSRNNEDIDSTSGTQ